MSKKNLNLFISAIFLLIGYSLGYIKSDLTQKPVTSPVPTETVLSATSGEAKYKVVKVIDGDTIQIEGGAKVRYIGIDTPETVDPKRKNACFGKEASDKNKELVEGKEVVLEKDVSETDSFGRLLRYVYVDNEMINEKLVKDGFAKVSTYPPDVKFAEKFLESEKHARENDLGLWSKCL